MQPRSILPPDVREQMERQRQTKDMPSGAGGIGGAAMENKATAHQRQVAMGDAPVPEGEDAEVPADVEEQESTCANEECNAELDNNWRYCAKCGTDILREGAAKRLGLEFGEDDIADYLFKGYVLRDLKILGKHTLTVKTSQPEDLEQVDDYIMNGGWSKQENSKEEKRVSDFHLRQKNQLAVTAANLIKVDGTSIGETAGDRAGWLNKKGSAFVDMVSQRVILFQQAFTEFLRKEDNILGS